MLKIKERTCHISCKGEKWIKPQLFMSQWPQINVQQKYRVGSVLFIDRKSTILWICISSEIVVAVHPYEEHLYSLSQVARGRWSSALTATTMPTSTLARGSTALTPTWARTTRWTKLCRAWRSPSASTPSTRTQPWRASSATRTPPFSSLHTRRGWAATRPQSTMLMVRESRI